jgi:hypothetical protein
MVQKYKPIPLKMMTVEHTASPVLNLMPESVFTLSWISLNTMILSNLVGIIRVDLWAKTITYDVDERADNHARARAKSEVLHQDHPKIRVRP